ncbi:glycine receptor subunit beta-like [Pollicipes pollicipes]|uniref:glycine receptor subunit beta-like n=1 Tax=Pollicipes pollicipes TaxID=41117 RepID=UPI0018851144|nr:glycine receptor subunit beta-like [Pollicipes pollicipes]
MTGTRTKRTCLHRAVLPADPTRVDLAGFLAPATTVETNGGLFHQVTMATVAQHCQFDYAHFPFDTQTCLIRLRSTSPNARLNVSDVRLEPDFDALQQKFAVRVRQRQPAAAHEQAVELQLRRRIGAHLARLYAPSALLVSASWLAALVPVSLIRSRLPVTILALLTLLLTEAPRSAAHAWEIGCLVFSLVSVLEAVLDMSISHD